MTTARSVDPLPEAPEPAQLGELVIIAIPLPTYRMISDYAKKHNMTAGQAIASAIGSVLKVEQPQPRVLTEKKGA